MEPIYLDQEDEKLLETIPSTELHIEDKSQIIKRLRLHQPVTSERNVWAFWDKGFDAVLPWCHRNVIDWVQRLNHSWTVRVLDITPGSPNNVYKFVGPEAFPVAFNQNIMNGQNKAQHASDFVRLALLERYGGVYMDVSTILFRDLEDICWTSLEDPNSPFEVAGFAYQCRAHFGQMFNGFIASRKNNPFIKRWMDIFLEMWKDRTDAAGLHQHPLIQHLGLLTPEDPVFGPNPDWKGYTDYCAQFLAYERLRLLREPGPTGFDGSEYFRHHFFLLDGWDEAFRGQDIYDGETHFELLSLDRRPEDVERDDRQRQAHDFVLDLVGRSSVAKFGQGYWLPGMPVGLTGFWARPEYADYDCRPGTWGEFVRMASTQCRQMRAYRACLTPLEIPEEKDVVVTAGYLEPIGSSL